MLDSTHSQFGVHHGYSNANSNSQWVSIVTAQELMNASSHSGNPYNMSNYGVLGIPVAGTNYTANNVSTNVSGPVTGSLGQGVHGI